MIIVDDGGVAPTRVTDAPARSVEPTADPAANATVTCPTCGRDVDPATDVCPFCDTPSSATARPSLRLPDGLVVALGVAPLVLGRLSPNRAVARGLDYDGVSRRHAELRTVSGRVVLRDLESTNHTFVGGIPITTETVLPPGEVVVGLGAHVAVTVYTPVPRDSLVS